MKNKNAFAAFIAAQVVLGVQWILNHQHYVHYTLTSQRQAMVTAAVITLVLLIGRDGIKGGITRGLTFVKKLWTGWGNDFVAPTIDQAKADEMNKNA